MYLKAVKYRDWFLAPGSRAMELYEQNKLKELDAHLKEVHNTYTKLTKETK